MRKTVLAFTSIAAIIVAAFVIVAAHKAQSEPCAACHAGDGGTVLQRMAQENQKWFIHAFTLIKGEIGDMRFAVPDEDRDNELVTLVFDSAKACEDARVNDPDLSVPLAQFEASIVAHGGSVAITCEPYQPKAEKGV